MSASVSESYALVTALPAPPRKNGRPTLYRPDYPAWLIAFFDISLHYEAQAPGEDGELKTVQIFNTFPTLARFAGSIGVNRVTLRQWATAKTPDGTLRHAEWAHAYARARDLQSALLVEGGISGAYPAKFACMMAKRLLGWRHREKSEPEITSGQ